MKAGFWFFLIALLTAVAMVWPSSTEARTKRNARFGFEFTYPDGFSLCPPGADGAAEVVALDSGDPVCRHRETQPVMGVGANFNALFERNAQESAASLCRDILEHDKTVRQGEAPALPRLGGLPSAVCRTDAENGWIDIIVIAMSRQRQNPPTGISAEEAKTPNMTYDAWLHTNADRLQHDLPLFRDMLKSIRFHKGYDN